MRRVVTRDHKELGPLLVAAALLISPVALPQQLPPLVIKAQGSFFVGGENKTITEPAIETLPESRGEITVNQMYVQYQVPQGRQRVPVVMIHGCCLSAKTWETTPDGRMGWSEYFLRKGYPVYLPDQVSRARSGFDPSAFEEIRAGAKPSARMPHIVVATHQLAWAEFRFGPRYGVAYADEKFPVEAVDELYKQLIPDLNDTLPEQANPTWTQLAALGRQLQGAVLISHSESGFFPERAALIDHSGIKGIVSLEPDCDPLDQAQAATLATVPTLVMFGDHIGDVQDPPVSWGDALQRCNKFVEQLKKAGGDAEMFLLPAHGIKGNSHMLMQDKNSNQVADLILTWIKGHVEVSRQPITGNSPNRRQK